MFINSVVKYNFIWGISWEKGPYGYIHKVPFLMKFPISGFILPLAGASVIISPSHDYITFENNASIFTFNCSGNGTSLLWIVDGQSAGSSCVLNKGIQYAPFIVSPDRLTVSSQLIVSTTKANNNITVICTVQDSLFNHQSSNPVKLYLQGTVNIIIHIFFDPDRWAACTVHLWL